jgi:hypothetical protein
LILFEKNEQCDELDEFGLFGVWLCEVLLLQRPKIQAGGFTIIVVRYEIQASAAKCNSTEF